MFKKLIALVLISTTLLTTSSLQAVRWNSRDWTNFALGTGLGIIGTSLLRESSGSCCTRETVVVQRDPVVVCREPIGCCPPQRVVYCEATTYCPRSNYDYVGCSTVLCVTSTCNSRTLTLNNGMVFEIAAGTLNWTGHRVTIYRDVTRGPISNYVLNLGGYQFRANRIEQPIPAPALDPIPAPRPR